MMTKQPRNHHVQRSLIHSWSAPNKQGRPDGTLFFYDFQDGKIHQDNSRRVFSRPGLNDADIEARLGQLVEHPLAEFRKKEISRRSRTDNTSAFDPDLKTVRALALVFQAQACRSDDAAAVSDTAGSRLAKLLAHPEPALNWFAAKFIEDFDLRTAGMYGHPLLYPEAGFFGIPVVGDSTRPHAVFGLPLTPGILLLAVPKGREFHWSEPGARLTVHFSVGVKTRGCP